jgi:TonB family protein
MPLIFPLIVAAAAGVPPARQTRASPAPHAVPAEPAATDEEVWALARKVGAPAAYMSYLDRFPLGAHRQEAIRISLAAAGPPVIFVPAPPAPPAPPPADTPCISLLVDQALNNADSDDGRAYLEARSGNRIADYQAYLGKFPNGACRPEATAEMRMRAERRLLVKPIAGFGPLAAKRIAGPIIDADDYPASALRAGEQGRVEAEWDVAEDGVPESCRIVRSSGSAALDQATCHIVTRRLLYDPARDAAGNPIRSADHMSVRWSLPDESPPPPSDKTPDKASK